MAKYANQKTIIRDEDIVKDAEHPYAKMSIEAMRKAMGDLNNYEFKLYCLLYMNQEGFEYDLSPAYLEKTFSGTRKTWSNARKVLEEKGYLRSEGNNKMAFVELPEKVEEEKVEVENALTTWNF